MVVRFQAGERNFHFSKTSRPTPGPTQLPIQLVHGAVMPGKREPESEAANPPSCRSELNNERHSTANNA